MCVPLCWLVERLTHGWERAGAPVIVIFAASGRPQPSSNLGVDPNEDVEELFDEPDVLDAKVEQLARKVKSADRVVVFTGAGISTSAGVCHMLHSHLPLVFCFAVVVVVVYIVTLSLRIHPR